MQLGSSYKQSLIGKLLHTFTAHSSWLSCMYLWSSVVVEICVEVKGAEERLPSFLICVRVRVCVCVCVWGGGGGGGGGGGDCKVNMLYH